MSFAISRRRFLATTSATIAAASFPKWSMAGAPRHSLTTGTRTLDINGRAATAFGLANSAGGQGLILDPGERFDVALTNALNEDTIIHWHGQIPPNEQDGVPDAPMPALKPGETRAYDFAPLAGTHWMHSHFPGAGDAASGGAADRALGGRYRRRPAGGGDDPAGFRLRLARRADGKNRARAWKWWPWRHEPRQRWSR